MKIDKFILAGALMLTQIWSSSFSLAQGEPESNFSERTQNIERGHELHERFSDRFAHKGYILLPKKYKLPKKSRLQFQDVIAAYLEMKNALTRDDTAGADRSSRQMEEYIGLIDGSQIEGDGLDALKQHTELLTENLQHLRHMNSLQKKRSYFSHISEIIYCSVKSFTLEFEQIYSVFCPVAFSGKGAFWVSTTLDGRNPYLGSVGIDCPRFSSEFIGVKKKSYVSPFGRRKR